MEKIMRMFDIYFIKVQIRDVKEIVEIVVRNFLKNKLWFIREI